MPFKCFSTKSEKVTVKKRSYEHWANTGQKVLLLDLMRWWCMCLYPGVLLLITDAVSKCPLRTFLSWVQSTGLLVVREEQRRGLMLTEPIGGWLLRTCGWSFHWRCLRWRNRFRMSSGLWEGLSCSLLPPDSPSKSLTGWALAVPEICSARATGSQRTCLESCLGSLGPQTQLLASLEGLWTLWLSLGLSP